ncbi:MAG: hypothetical protein ABR936_13670 [Bacteroidota bacterium]|jgi:hypothetical protein
MKKLLTVILAIGFTAVFISLQNKMDASELHNKSHSMVGYLVDYNCGKRMAMDDIKKSDAKAAKHTKDCALDEACSAKGYGLVTGGRFYKFDVSGDVKAKEYLKATLKESNIKVEVIGTMNDDKLVVELIKDLQSTGKKTGKKN